MLDPIKVTILTPGDRTRRELSRTPASPPRSCPTSSTNAASSIEKTGAYSFLVLFSLGITNGKDRHAAQPSCSSSSASTTATHRSAKLSPARHDHPERYEQTTLRGLAAELPPRSANATITELTEAMYAQLPEPVVIPAAAYQQLISGTVEMVDVDEPRRPGQRSHDRPLPARDPRDHARRTIRRQTTAACSATSPQANRSTLASPASKPRSTASTSTRTGHTACPASQRTSRTLTNPTRPDSIGHTMRRA